jgi:phenylalanyl-tRNA synthetase beta chain
MNISIKWLKQYIDVKETPEELAHMLTMAGLEVASVDLRGGDISDIVIGQIEEKGQHPNADRLSLCKVTDGTESFPIVCGATNMKAGDRVALARVGSVLPGDFKIKKAKLRGEVSMGMMCSYRELGLGDDHDGIIILPPDAPLGERFDTFMGLPDTVLEVEITPNRPDWLSVVGVARELAALTGRELRLPEPKIEENSEEAANLTSVEIKAPELCHRYAARLIKGVKIGPSPIWMQSALEAAGVRPISNVVDVTNFVLMELGHPLHAFDFNKLRGKRIVVNRAAAKEKFTTLDNEERVMNAENLMIADAEGSVAVAGVMGGLNSEVSDDTVDVLLESAWFLPTNIRRTSKELGLKSEAAYRFERGADIEGLMLALERATELIVQLAGGSVCKGVIDEYPTRGEKKRLTLRMEKCTKVLGVAVQTAQAAEFMRGLGLAVLNTTEDTVEVEVPCFRVDLEREIDLIEEVARLYGYDNIPVTMPRIAMSESPASAERTLQDAMRDAMASAGLMEAVTLSFIDPDDDDLLKFAEDNPLRAKVGIQNPLGKETSVMRTSLLPGLLHAAELNNRRGNRDIRLFEVGATFHPDTEGGKLPVETQRACAVMAGRRDPLAWWADADKLDFYDAKGALEHVLARLDVRNVRFEPISDIEWLHPSRGANIIADGKILGWLGELLPDVLDSYVLAAPVIAFQLNLAEVGQASSETGTFPGLHRFPAVERDLALVVDGKVHAQKILDTVEDLGEQLVRSVVLFDAFEGGKVPEGKQSLAIRTTYRDDSRTLTEEEVAPVEAKVIKTLEEKLGAKLRDS